MKRSITLVLFLSSVCLLLLPLFAFSQIGPPGQEEAKGLVQRVVTSTKPYFGSFWRQKVVPFFVNLAKKIKIWWEEKGKIEINNLWEEITTFLNKEIVIE